MMPALPQLFAAFEAAWPPVSRTALGPFAYRHGAGGGQRVSAATAEGPWSERDIDAVETRFAADGLPPIFMVRSGEEALDASLAARGYAVRSPVTLRVAPITAFGPDDPERAYTVWPPLAIQREIWALDHIGPARVAVMDRAACARTTLLARLGSAPAGAAYVGLSDGVASVHALVTPAAHRRQGVARALMLTAARWARDKGATHLAVQVETGNAAANALYSSLGMTQVGHYHYRVLP